MKNIFADTIGDKIFNDSTTLRMANLADSSARYAIKYLLQATVTIKNAEEMLSASTLTDPEVITYWETTRHYAKERIPLFTAILCPYFPGKRIVTTARNLVTSSTTDEQINDTLIQAYIDTI